MSNENTLSNFIPINRKLFSHPFWNEKRTYSKAEAWIDLLQMARYDDSEGKVITQGKIITYSRTELPASTRFLAIRWKWGKSKIAKFLDLLKIEGMISIRLYNGQSIIKIINYDLYNKSMQNQGSNWGSSKLIQDGVSEDSQGNDRPNVGAGSGQRQGKSNIDNKEEIVNKENTLLPELEDFKMFWGKYNKSVSKQDCIKLYSKISKSDKVLIMAHLEKYIPSTPDPKYRKDPKTYLKGRCWLDEIIPYKTKQTNNHLGGGAKIATEQDFKKFVP